MTLFSKKRGTPEIGDLLLCTVKRILYHSVFVTFDEYEGREGMIHISEIAPGRIRNLRDYVTEGKKIVAKVININKQTNNIDLSLRRVGVNQRVEKLNEYKQEEKAEKLLETIGKEFKLDLKAMYEKLGNKIVENYGSLYGFFRHLTETDANAINEIDAPKELKDALFKAVTEKIKPVTIKISGTLTLQTYASNGIDDIKKILTDIEKHGANIIYLGAPRYQVNITAHDYKDAEHTLKGIIDNSLTVAKKHGIDASFAKSAS